MTIKKGDPLPNVNVTVKGDGSPQPISIQDYAKGKKIIIVTVVGAFTPVCNNNHLTGYLEKLDDIQSKGVNQVAVLAVNDIHVMKAWEKASEAEGKIDFLADGNGDFARQTGLDLDCSGFNMGLRIKRAVMVVDDGLVKELLIEDNPGAVVSSSAESILKLL
jgi:glutaredoxin/glutathione-dependent peroxiredoxin